MDLTALAHLKKAPGGADWLALVPSRVSERVAAWDLELGTVLPGGSASWVSTCRTRAGREAVLKLPFPHRESEHEADALAAWNGQGAVELIARDPKSHALLLERCVPGLPLAEADPDRALDVLVHLLPRLWVAPPPGMPALAVEAEWWRTGLADAWEQFGRPLPRALLAVALEALVALPSSQGEQVLVNQDLHGGNILSAEREPWLVIDPKPLAGEREFAVAPIVRSHELGHSRREVVGRLDRLGSDLGLDRERCRLWTIAQTVSWSCGPGADPRHVEAAQWLADVR